MAAVAGMLAGIGASLLLFATYSVMQLQEATVAYVDTPEGIAEAQESWDIDTASDTPFHDDEDTVATEAEGESTNN